MDDNAAGYGVGMGLMNFLLQSQPIGQSPGFFGTMSNGGNFDSQPARNGMTENSGRRLAHDGDSRQRFLANVKMIVIKS